jgi:hypothetical protein
MVVDVNRAPSTHMPKAIMAYEMKCVLAGSGKQADLFAKDYAFMLPGNTGHGDKRRTAPPAALLSR